MNAQTPARHDEPTPGHADPLLYNLVYCSRAVAGVDAAAVDRIVASARRRNPAYGITGLLVYGGGVFFQWLEGPRESVVKLMALLQTDPRHESIVTLSVAEEVRERLFPEWDMELVGAEEVRDVLADAMASAEDPHSVDALNRLLAELDAAPPG